MLRSTRLLLVPALTLALAGLASPASAADDTVRAAFLVDAESYLGAALMTGLEMRSGEGLQAEEIEIVVVGPAVKALGPDGKLAPMLAKARKAGVRVVACKFAMDKLGVKTEALAPGVEVVGNGFTRILERERDGWLTLEM